MLRATSDAGKAAGDAVLVLSLMSFHNVMIDCASIAFSVAVADKSLEVFLTRYPMPYPSSPQNMMRRNLPAEKRLTLDWRKARHF